MKHRALDGAGKQRLGRSNTRDVAERFVSMPGHRVVPNPLNRFLLNSHSPLVGEPDGSLRIFVGPRPPEGVPQSNWLPSSDWKPFLLTMRTYVPKAVVTSGEWFPPALAIAGNG